MKKGWKITLIALAALVLIGPFLVPVRAPENTVPPETLADPDSVFMEIDGLNVHLKRAGADTPVFILLHGFGASTFSWREVMDPLSAYGTVIAYDRPAFGLTERPLDWQGTNPYSQEGNISLLLGLMEALGVERTILVGNSAGGTLGTAFTLDHPDRVQADPAIIAGYRKPLRAENWDRALWEHTKAAQTPGLTERLGEIQAPTLVISGAYDQIVPVEDSLRLAEDIPGAQLAVIDKCGHLPQEECPGEFLAAIISFLEIQLEETNAQ